MPFNPYKLGEILRGHPLIQAPVEEGGYGIIPDTHPYEVLRQLQAKRKEDPDLDSLFTTIESKGYTAPLPSAASTSKTLIKTGLNAAAMGIPDYAARKWGVGLFNPITDEEAQSTAGKVGEIGGTIGGFFVPGMGLAQLAKVGRLGKLAGVAGRAAGVLKGGEQAATALGGSKWAPIAHGLSIAGVGAGQGIGRSANLQARQIQETGQRQTPSTAPFVAEAVGNALIAPFGGSISSRLLKGAVSPLKARLGGAALGAAKGYAGMGTLVTGQEMAENPKLSATQAADLAIGNPMSLLGAGLGAAAGGFAPKFLSPALNARYKAIREAADAKTAGAQAAAPARTQAAETLRTPEPPPQPPVEDIAPVRDPMELRKIRDIQAATGPVQQSIATIRNLLSGAGESFKDILHKSKSPATIYFGNQGEMIGRQWAKPNRFGYEPATIMTAQGDVPVTKSAKGIKDAATGWAYTGEFAREPHKIPMKYEQVYDPFELTSGGRKVRVVGVSPEEAIGFDESGTLVRVPREPQRGAGTESLGSGGAGSYGAESTELAAKLGAKAEEEAAKKVPLTRLKTREFVKLQAVIKNILSEPDYQDIIPGIMTDNPDLQPYIRSAIRMASPEAYAQIFGKPNARPRTRKNPRP